MRKLIGTIVVLLVVVAVVAYVRGWINIPTKSPTDDKKVTVTVDVDKDKFKADTDAALDKAKAIGDKIKDRVHEETAKGMIMKIEPADHRVMVKTGDKEVAVHVESTTKIRSGDQTIQLKDLREGDQVTVVFTTKDGKNLAKSITVERAT